MIVIQHAEDEVISTLAISDIEKAIFMDRETRKEYCISKISYDGISLWIIISSVDDVERIAISLSELLKKFEIYEQ